MAADRVDPFLSFFPSGTERPRVFQGGGLLDVNASLVLDHPVEAEAHDVGDALVDLVLRPPVMILRNLLVLGPLRRRSGRVLTLAVRAPDGFLDAARTRHVFE